VAFDGDNLNIITHAIYPEYALYFSSCHKKIYTRFGTRTMALQNTTTRKMQPLPGIYKLKWK
jgi:hypothetical protein